MKEGDTMYPRVLDINMNLVAVLNRSYKIGYTKIKNNLWTCQFTLPLNDKKNEHVKPKYFIDLYDHDRYIGKFIVNPKKTIKNESTNEITYNCEHVLSTLHSDVLFGYFQYTNHTTRQVLEFLLEQQEVKHWKLGACSFTRYFHYAWENEDSLANAIFSVPKPFDVPYLWTWDDSAYPFELNLIEPTSTIKDIIASGKNLKGIEIDEDPTNIVTRIYPLGAGEGVNQLTIKDVNNGIPYLENTAAREEHGLHKRVWVDQRFEDDSSLKASGQAILDKYSKPIKSIAIDCRDYTLYERKRKRELMALYDVGDMLLVHDQDTNTHEEIRLEKIDKNDIYGSPQDIQLELGSLIEDISTTFTDLEKKQLVNETYSQGATNILNFGYQDNADNNIPAMIPFYIDDDVVNINTCELTFRTKKFRTYSETTESAGQVIQTIATGGGGGTVKSSTTGGGGGTVQSSTTEGGGGSNKTSAAGGDHRHLMFSAIGFSENLNPESSVSLRAANGHTIMVNDGTHAALEYYTEGTSGNHTHTYETPVHDHKFSFTLLPHTHAFEFTLEPHTHPVTFQIAGHSHDVRHKIIELDELPTSVLIKVDGNLVTFNGTSGDRLNLVDYLQKDADGKVTRGRHEVEILPNARARIEADLILRVFIQSRLGGNY